LKALTNKAEGNATGEAGYLDGSERARLRRGIAAQSDGQDPQARAAQELL